LTCRKIFGRLGRLIALLAMISLKAQSVANHRSTDRGREI